MKEDRTRDSTSTESTVDPLPKPEKKFARRSFLVSGAKLAPVVAATLASRPSLAGQCVMPSAWGSVALAVGQNDMGGVGTLTGSIARFPVRSFTAYSISDWTTDAPWLVFAGKFTFPNDVVGDSNKVAYLKGLYRPPAPSQTPALTVASLCSIIKFSPPKGGENTTPIRAINQGGFFAAILVAEFNIFLGKIPLGDHGCLPSSDVLNKMAGLTYIPSGSTVAWSQTQIIDYLHYNYLAR